VLRIGEDREHVDVLLGAKEQDGKLWLPKGFLREGEDAPQAVDRILKVETGWQPESHEDHPVHEGYFYDQRQTDHAWVEIQAFLSVVEFADAPREFRPGGDFETVRWMPIDVQTINRMPSAEARIVRQAIKRLEQEQRISETTAGHMLARMG
jgi:ADP-ribose pyrophosphatase YjhB (NUDIX family)